MIAEFSEFSFGYAITAELQQRYGVVSAPEFPSLVAEGRPGGGYDVKVRTQGVVIFLQFTLHHSGSALALGMGDCGAGNSGVE